MFFAITLQAYSWMLEEKKEKVKLQRVFGYEEQTIIRISIDSFKLNDYRITILLLDISAEKFRRSA